ncbi:MAG: hypothetical protein OXN97_06220 [Bryobacterales bacterium]|nr:hypothetical protein [Bryobacterales bacterium]
MHRSPTPIDNGTHSCIARQGYHLRHNSGHGSDGLANLLVFAFHSVLDSLRGLWCQIRTELVTHRHFFGHLRVSKGTPDKNAPCPSPACGKTGARERAQTNSRRGKVPAGETTEPDRNYVYGLPL